MESASSSSSSSTPIKSEAKQLKTTAGGGGGGLFSLINDDLLHNILARLPALSFASAACVSKSWSQICSRILSRPKVASALSLHPALEVAWEEVTEKVLAEPIRPHFIIANVGGGFRLFDIRKLILNKFGSRAPFVVSTANGILGRDALTREIMEVKWDGVSGDVSDEDCSIPAEDGNYGIVLTVGFVPGLKVDAIPLLSTSVKEPREVFIDKFLLDIKDYTASISDCTAPVGIIMFGDGCTNMRPVVNALDYALPKETVIVGDEKGRFLYRSENESRNVCGSAKYFSVAVALIFARDKDNCVQGIGDIQFQIALSEGVATVGPRYKAVSVRASTSDSTWLTARREGHPEILDGQRILNDINDELENHADSSDLYIGVIKRRSISTGSEKRKLVTSLDFHGVVGGDESYLYVNDVGIKTGDYFHFYRPDPHTALSSCRNLCVSLKNLKMDENSKDCHHLSKVFGGFIFACCGRGESFFEQVNVDSFPFVENFPGVPLAGIFCGGEIGRGSLMLTGEAQKDSVPSCSLHVYSTIYLVLSYTPAALDH